MSYQKLRQQVLERDNYTCQICLKKFDKLDVNHIIPRSKKGIDSINNLTSVCEKCHSLIELAPKRIIKKILETVLPTNKSIQVNFRASYTEMGNKLIIIVPKKYHEDIKKMKKPIEVLVEAIE